MIPEVAEADPHVMVQGVWHCNRHTQTKDAVGHTESIDVPVAQKQNA